MSRYLMTIGFDRSPVLSALSSLSDRYLIVGLEQIFLGCRGVAFSKAGNELKVFFHGSILGSDLASGVRDFFPDARGRCMERLSRHLSYRDLDDSIRLNEYRITDPDPAIGYLNSHRIDCRSRSFFTIEGYGSQLAPALPDLSIAEILTGQIGFRSDWDENGNVVAVMNAKTYRTVRASIEPHQLVCQIDGDLASPVQSSNNPERARMFREDAYRLLNPAQSTSTSGSLATPAGHAPVLGQHVATSPQAAPEPVYTFAGDSDRFSPLIDRCTFYERCNRDRYRPALSLERNATDGDLLSDGCEINICLACGSQLPGSDSGYRLPHGGRTCCTSCLNCVGLGVHDDRVVPLNTIPVLGSASLNRYNHANPTMYSASGQKPYRIGYEVEKEDPDFLSAHDMSSYAGKVDWIAVSDGSLEHGGFELVSPAYNLANRDAINRSFRELGDAINARVTKRCGGHITVSQANVSGETLADRLGDFHCLLFALYPNRLLGNWAKIRRADQMEAGAQKYRAINVKRECVEFRIFSAVRNVAMLEWRTDLVKWGLSRKRKKVEKAIDDQSGFLIRHLRKRYAPEKLARRLELFAGFQTWYYGDELPEDHPAARYCPAR